MKRYGIYYAPPAGSALARFGADWLGWDAEAGRACRPDPMPELPLDWESVTATPRRYGFHGTLKPPFALAPGTDVQGLLAAVEALAAGIPAFGIPPFAPSLEHGFLSLRPSGPSEALEALAADCVRALDRFRAPPSEAELARRRKAALSPAQEAHLARWGYPYVMEQFRFHLTLSGHLGPEDAAALRDALRPLLAPLTAPGRTAPEPVRELCVFGDPGDGPFHLLHRVPLTG
ncbi:DUF1045 domain-containing protein [Paroceanicella profunda]|uniref:DUF1045 domain-containing protein n=1 Tax=Paroceanicella profunda TaxID=2579971 RepID=A0A5B8FGI0_9RHOB|nr:DUF1045 domain-containing protein [Paroceanicella profunda]QDL91057.1 DUF1045 domain-containing protein [Paroceanicella profunda]